MSLLEPRRIAETAAPGRGVSRSFVRLQLHVLVVVIPVCLERLCTIWTTALNHSSTTCIQFSTRNSHTANTNWRHSSEFTTARQVKRFQATRKAVLVSCLRDSLLIPSWNYRIMVMRYLNLAILASTALSQSAPESANSNNMARQLADYPVEAYICLDDNSEVLSPAALLQGSFLQVCIKIDDTVITDNILVEDILSFVVSQPDGPATYAETITNAVADPLTEKICRESGICNVRTQLLSKFFTETIPGNLRVEGVAILAIGNASLMPSAAPTVAVRRLHAPIRGLLSGDDVKAHVAAQLMKAQSVFGVDVGINSDSGGQGSSNSTAVVAAIVLIVLVVGSGFVGFVWSTIRSHKEKAKNIVDRNSSNASVGTSPTQASVYSSSPSQSESHLPNRRTTTITTTTTETSRSFLWFLYQKKPRGEDTGITEHHSSNASVGTSPSQACVYSPSSSQHVSHRGARDQQLDCIYVD
jgi:hypothetical protein